MFGLSAYELFCPISKWTTPDPPWRLGPLLAAALLSSHSAFATTPAEDAIMRQQDALVWTTDYEGLIDGKAGPETTRAIKKFQARIGNPQTGALDPTELDLLLKAGGGQKKAAGFREITDTSAGVSLGIPLAFVSSPTSTKWGQHWYGRQAGLAIDTLRFGSEVSLRDLFDKLLSINNRTITYQRFVDDRWFVISALEGDAAVYVRAQVVNMPDDRAEIRGFSIWMSKQRPAEYQALAPAMMSSFRATGGVGGVFQMPPAAKVSNVPQLQPNPPPIKTNSGPPANLDECFRGLGPSTCPPMLAARP